MHCLAGLLLLTLTFFLGLAGFLTSGLLGIFLLNRLFFHLRDNEGKGIAGWAGETKSRFIEVPQNHTLNGIDRRPAPAPATTTTAHFARSQPQIVPSGDRSDDWQTTDDETVQLNVKPERIST